MPRARAGRRVARIRAPSPAFPWSRNCFPDLYAPSLVPGTPVGPGFGSFPVPGIPAGWTGKLLFQGVGFSTGTFGLIERLLALVPRPRRHLVTYHGVLAPAAGLRSRVVPRWDESEEVVGETDALAEQEAGAAAIDALRRCRRSVPHAPGHRGRPRGGVRRYPWAGLRRRVFAVEVLVCPHCGGARRLLLAIHDPASIELRQSAPRQAGRVGAAGEGVAS